MPDPVKDTRREYDDLFARARVSLTNGRDVPEVQALLAPYGYDAKRLDGGLALLAAAEEASRDQVEEYAEQYAATTSLAEELEAWRAAYMRHLGLARLRFRGDAHARTLGLGGERRDDLGGLLMQGRLFYEGLRDNAALAAEMAEWKVTPEVIAGGLAGADAVDAARVAQEKEMGEAEVATRLRDDAVGRLRGFLRDYEGLARLVLADTPQLREVLGLVDPGS